MAFLHNSPIKFHGRLKSSNVLIDARWTCKVADFGLRGFREGERLAHPLGDPAYFYRKRIIPFFLYRCLTSSSSPSSCCIRSTLDCSRTPEGKPRHSDWQPKGRRLLLRDPPARNSSTKCSVWRCFRHGWRCAMFNCFAWPFELLIMLMTGGRYKKTEATG